MSTTNSSCKPILPSITLIKSDSTEHGKTITFPNDRPITPFSPTVEAYFEEKKLQVSALVFIDAAANIESGSIKVYYNNTQETPVFYIVYDAPESQATKFSMYQVNFEIILHKKPLTIQTFLWDSDPVGSRGTTTTVQPID